MSTRGIILDKVYFRYGGIMSSCQDLLSASLKKTNIIERSASSRE